MATKNTPKQPIKVKDLTSGKSVKGGHKPF
jgi:hypothetical protein